MQLLLSTACLALTSAVIGNAYYQKNQFYPAVVYITKSNASMAVIYIQFFVIVFMFGKLLRKIFLGTLRAAEFEHLLERFWYAITETCLAFTVFRDDFNPRFVALFTVLLFLKSFHWLAEERVDFMERSPVLGWLFHIRVASLLTLLGTFDYILLMHAYNSTLERGPTVQLVFGFEYAILLTVVASTAIKYVLHTAEMRTDTPWENKAVFLLYTELVIGLIKVILYVLFVVIMVKIYALPMFVFRPMFFTIRSFKKALSDVIMSRRAIRNMNTLYPDATPEELRLSDNICIICREDMLNHSKKLPCGHIFHTTCLRSWFQRQQTCPTCRLNILRAPVVNSTALGRAEEAAAAAAVGGAAPVVGGGIAGMPPNLLPGVGLAAPGAMQQAPNVAAAGAGATTVLVNGVEQLRADGVNGATTTTTTTNIFETLGGGYFSNYAAGMPMLPPPLMMPPPFPFIAPYAVPPPPMPPDLTNLSDDELRAMEGIERKHVEERLKLLRNIQQMLDAAGILMNNYQIITSRLPVPPAPTVIATAAANTTDKPSTSAEAAAALTAATVNCIAAAAAATNLDNIHTQQPNNEATTIVDVASCTTSTIESTTSSTVTTTETTASAAAPQNKLNNVTIEDISGDFDDENVTSTSSSSTSPITTIIKTTTTTTSTTSNDNADTTELNELRRRRIKFLEELNKTKMTTETTTATTRD